MTRVRQTSIDVYHQIESEGLLSKRRWEVYHILFNHGPMTSNETFDYSKLHGVDGYRHNANARMTELRELGVVQEIGTTLCSKTGRRVILWDVTSNLPKEPPKKDPKISREHLESCRETLVAVWNHPDLPPDIKNLIRERFKNVK